MIDFLGTVVISAVMVLNLNAFISAITVPRLGRLALAAIVGLWVGLAAATANAGMLPGPQPIIGLFVFVPILAAIALAVGSPAVRAALLALPMPLLVGLNIMRVFAFFFLWLAAVDRLGGPFPYSAALGDIITGVFAVPAIWLAARASVGGDRRLALWNAFGILDLVVAIALGITSANGSVLQVIHADAGSEAMQSLPWSFVPTVLVPFYLIVHGVIAVQLRARAASLRRPTSVVGAAQVA